MFDVVGIGLNAIDYLVALQRFPVPGEKLRMSAFKREGGGQVATALVALSRWGYAEVVDGASEEYGRDLALKEPFRIEAASGSVEEGQLVQQMPVLPVTDHLPEPGGVKVFHVHWSSSRSSLGPR